MSTETAPPPDHDPAPPVPDPGITEPKKKKHKTGTLRRALSWLRGRRKKKPEAKQDGKGHAKPDGNSQAIPAPEDDPGDNVFFPAGRTPFLEDIHSQAQEGLKSMQRREKLQSKPPAQDENKNTQSPDDAIDNGFRARSLSCSTENTDDAMSVRSEMIQRKGSTFRPHEPPRSPSGKSGRRRKEKRATVVGVPHHIAAELGLQSRSSLSHRGIHDLFPGRNLHRAKDGTSNTIVNGTSGTEQEFVVIPTVDGNPTAAPHDGARISLTALENTDAALQRHIDRLYKDDSCLGWKSGSKISPLFIRPKSLAVPGMTTHSPQSDLVSPVMSISPQATYLSKIIPNAVLPPMVDVVALSRSSVRTLSRCSLASASPASIRGSLHRGRGQSFSSETWSRSQSTETIVSDSSTISSHGGNLHERSERLESDLITGRTSPALSTGTQDGSDAASLCSGRSSSRSVSLRKSKKAPPPPKRTYSLQQQREMGLPPRPERKPVSKPNTVRDPWVLRKDGTTADSDVFSATLDEGKLSSPSRSERTLSPSSGYSSQSGTPTLPAKALLEYPESPGSRRKTPPKPERSSLVKSMAVVTTTSSSENKPHLASPPTAVSITGDQEIQDVIPPHPKVPAPLCPPPNKNIRPIATPSATPPPSPPPSHHPTPPPARKSESDADMQPSTLVQTSQKECLWPPPPPEAPDEQDLSMADFPPPEDDIFLVLPPVLESEGPPTDSSHISSHSNSEQEALGKEASESFTHDENALIIANASNLEPASMPHNATETTSAPVPPKVMESSQLSVPQSSEPLVVLPSDTSDPLALLTYKPHFTTSTTEHVVPLELTLPPHVPVDQSATTLTESVSKTSTVNTVLPPSPVTTALQPTVKSTDPGTPLVPESPSLFSKPSGWKPVSAPGGSIKKVVAPNQIVESTQKEDASLPIVTPSLLQMVRLRSIQVRGPQVQSPQSPGLPAPQKPVRKSLSLKSPPVLDSPPGDVPTGSSHVPLKPPDSGHSPTVHRSPASAASFVFARGPRKFVFEPPASPEAEASLKKDLVTELKAHGGPRSPDGKPPLQRKPSKVPPPVARKPSVGIPRTPSSPQTPTAGSNGSVCTTYDPGPTPPSNGTNVAVTLAGHEQPHQSPVEQA
ncbi:NHS-like protein 3 [Pelodytes ibericus]